MVSGQGHLQKTFYPIYFLCANTISYQKLGYLCASWWRPDSWRKQHVSLLNEIIRATKVYNHLISMYLRTCVMCTPAMVTERCGRAGCGCHRRQRQQRLIRCAGSCCLPFCLRLAEAEPHAGAELRPQAAACPSVGASWRRSRELAPSCGRRSRRGSHRPTRIPGAARAGRGPPSG